MPAEWQSLGPAEREREPASWDGFRGAVDEFFTWYDEQRPGNLEKKQALLAELETVLATTDMPGGDRATDMV